MILQLRPFSFLALGAALALSACTQFPELDAVVTPEGEAAPEPDLAPLDPLLAPGIASREQIGEIQQADAELRNRATATRELADDVTRIPTQDEATRKALEERRRALAAQRDADTEG